MAPRTYRLLALLAATSPLTCSLFQSRPTTPEGADAQSAVRLFTDSDIVLDVAASERNVFVATYRGVVRYDANGEHPARFTEAEGLPGNDVVAVSVTDDGRSLWAATPHGIVKGDDTGHWASVGDAQPDIGAPTALLALADGALVGGARGIARWDGAHWSVLTDRYQVTAFASEGGRVFVATANAGVLVLSQDFSAVDEHGLNAGINDVMVRDLVATTDGKLWAITQGTVGATLNYFDGARWFTYTSEHVRAQWLALVPAGNSAVLITPGAHYTITLDRGEDLTPMNAAPAGGQRHVELHPVVCEPPPAPPPPPPEVPVRGRGRRPAPGARPTPPGSRPAAPPVAHPAPGAPRPGARPTAPAAHPGARLPVLLQVVGADAGTAPRGTDAGVAQPVAVDAGRPDAAPPSTPDAGRPDVVTVDASRPDVIADAGSVDVSTQDVSRTDVSMVDTGRSDAGRADVAQPAVMDGGAPRSDAAIAPTDAVMVSDAAVADAAPVPVVLPPIQHRDIPATAFPAEVPHGGPTLDAPTFGLVRGAAGRVPADVLRVDVTNRNTFVSRIGLGVSRLAVRDGAVAADFRVHDLAMQSRPLSLATDATGNVWMVSEDGGPVRYDGRVFTRVQLDDDPRVHPLMFWSRGRAGAAVARVGDTNVLRGYRLEGNNWRRIADGPVETYGPGTVDVKFLAGDAQGRLWVGLRVRADGHVRELGCAVLDPNTPVAVQYNANVPETGGENGARRAPNDLSAVEFDREGNAWFAGLDGATRINAQGVRRFRESDGLRGDVVNDLARASGDRLYFATPEGLGVYENNAFSFAIEGSTAAARVIALSVDNAGNLWGAGARGAWRYDGRTFERIGPAQHLPVDQFNDLAIDAQNRVWFTTTDGILLFDQAVAAGQQNAPH